MFGGEEDIYRELEDLESRVPGPEMVDAAERKAYRRHLPLDERKVAAVAVMSSLAIQGIMLLVIIVTNLIFLSKRPRGNFVQLIDGRVVEVSQQERDYRHPEVIRRFVLETIYLLFTWDGLLPARTIDEQIKRRPDPGVDLGFNQGRVPTLAFEGGFAFRPGLRENLLLELGKLVPGDIWQNNPQSQGANLARTFPVIEFISQPRVVKAGQWEVDVVATIYYLPRQGPMRVLLPFNRRLVVEVAEPLQGGEGTGDVNWYGPVSRVRASGLRIIEIKGLKL